LALTWPKCDATRQDVQAKLEIRFKDNILGCAIAQEQHEDGTPHIHVALRLKTRIDIKNATDLDIITGQHGNYQVQRSIKKWTAYVLKSDEFAIKWGEILDDESWTTILQTKDKKQMWEKLLEFKPRDAAINGKRIVENWEYHQSFKKSKFERPERKMLPFHPTNLMAEWVIDNIHRVDVYQRTRCLIIHGGPGLGKTEWARSLFPPGNIAYFQGNFNLKKLLAIEKLDLIIFDDCEWQYLPQKKMLLQAKGETELTDKYHKKETVHIHAPAIFLTNNEGYLKDPEYDSYWKTELDIVSLYGPLF